MPDTPLSIETWFRSKRIAVCGATPRPEKWGYKVFKRLLDAGYDAIPVHPVADQIEGHACVHSLRDIQPPPDAISVITPPQVSLEIVRTSHDLNSIPIWFQPGSADEQVLEEAKRLGVPVIMGPCVLVELGKRGF